VNETTVTRDEYIQRVLNTYRATPGTSGMIRRPDRLFAEQLHARGVPLSIVENAMVLAVFRRLFRAPGLPPLNTIQSLAYFSPVIEETIQLRISPQYFQYARMKIKRLLALSPDIPAARLPHK
jgi:hypothetical protein